MTTIEKGTLRSRAEARLKAKEEKNGNADNLYELPGKAMQRLVHELQTHQIELEMQNEELVHIQEDLQASRDRLFDLYHKAPVAYLTLDSEFRVIELNQSCLTLLGLNYKQIFQKQFNAFVVAEDQDAWYLYVRSLMAGGSNSHCDLRLINYNQNEPLSVSLNGECDDRNSAAPQIRLAVSNMTAMRKMELAFQVQRNLFLSILSSTPDLISLKRKDLTYQLVNRAFTDFYGVDATAVVGKADSDIFSPSRAEIERLSDNSTMETGLPTTKDLRVENERGNYWFQITKVPIFEENGRISAILSTSSDISVRKQQEQLIWQQANYDLLTSLPNRSLFIDRLKQTLQLAMRQGSQVALMLLDLDRFKWVNDTLGHAAGDLLLKEVARRLKEQVRETDTVARLGGDEFTVIFSDVVDKRNIKAMAQNILKCLARPIEIFAHEDVVISASAGLTIFPEDATDYDSLLKNADIAMYRAKNNAKSRLTFFTEDLNKRFIRRHKLSKELRVAVEQAQWQLHYQPIVDLKTQRIHSFEVLLRWLHPRRGIISPNDFIPALESSGLIIEVGEWVLCAAIAQASTWQQSGHEYLSIAVNVSSTQIKCDFFFDRLKQILHESPLLPGTLRLEITESSILDDTEINADKLQQIEAHGAKLSLDDFGTGYSCLAQLKRFPIDTVKIDRHFVKDIARSSIDAQLVQGVIALAHTINMKTVAEGIEDKEQLDLLVLAGADLGQGYYFSKPLEASGIPGLLDKTSWSPS